MLGKLSSLTDIVNSLRENGVRDPDSRQRDTSYDNVGRKLRHHGVRTRPNTKVGHRVVLWG